MSAHLETRVFEHPDSLYGINATTSPVNKLQNLIVNVLYSQLYARTTEPPQATQFVTCYKVRPRLLNKRAKI